MKKLIIAAAVAVVAGGAFALDGYDFTATLKTTKGKSGKDTVTINLGADASGQVFWYQEPTLASWFANPEYATTKTVGGFTVPTLKKDKVASDADLQKKIKAAAATYKFKSAGKWCETYKFTDENCYRVAGSAKIAVDLYTSNCCAIVTAGKVLITNTFETVYGVNEGGIYIDETTTESIGPGFINRFGSLVYTKATKVEMFGGVKALPTTDNRVFIAGALAGQGTYSKDRVSSVSGNIVGYMMPTLCPSCCTKPFTAIAFLCDDPTPHGGYPLGEKPQGSDYAEELPTAAFGTFRLKYNSWLAD